jgi:hypothetical protein
VISLGDTEVKPELHLTAPPRKTLIFIGILVDVAGIEPATPCLQSARLASNKQPVLFNC